MSACESTVTPDGVVCLVHGAAWISGQCLTQSVLADFAEHRQFQFENFGPNRDLKDGTGPGVEWLAPVLQEGWAHFNKSHYPFEATAYAIEGLFREEWDFDVNPNAPYSWLMMLREEFAEVAGQADPDRLEEELVQLGALCASWVEKIRERRAGAPLGSAS